MTFLVTITARYDEYADAIDGLTALENTAARTGELDDSRIDDEDES